MTPCGWVRTPVIAGTNEKSGGWFLDPTAQHEYVRGEGYIYSDSRCQAPVLVNQPAEPDYPDYLPVGPVQGRPGLRGLKG